ncbi:MAG: MBL fold metallo-hydrolase [Gallionellaceae bacterium]|jgi:phosphoribosyl 1,2-cyclic phosphodiesterase
MRFASLGSGSEGNALLIEVGQTRILMDCGFSLSETTNRLSRLQLTPEQLHGIVVTHEHSDHIGGVARLAKKYSLPVYLTHGTLRSQLAVFSDFPLLNEISSHLPFSIGEINIHPFPVPHDADEPVQYVFSDGTKKLGVLTDSGSSTPHIESMLNRCDALILECNHDIEMLKNGKYPQHLKKRVGGKFGHLNNQEAAALLARLDNSKLQYLVAAHLSQQNNKRELAIHALINALAWPEEKILIATQDEGVSWCEIS